MRDFPGRCCVPAPARPNRCRSGYDGRRALPSQPLQSTVNRPRTSTIYDLAELAGTSASTVSAILNGSWQSRRISEATARRDCQRSEEHTSELQSPDHLVCRLLLEKKKHTEHAPQ